MRGLEVLDEHVQLGTLPRPQAGGRGDVDAGVADQSSHLGQGAGQVLDVDDQIERHEPCTGSLLLKADDLVPITQGMGRRPHPGREPELSAAPRTRRGVRGMRPSWTSASLGQLLLVVIGLLVAGAMVTVSQLARSNSSMISIW